MKRRRAVSLAASSLAAALAGCLGGGSGDSDDAGEGQDDQKDEQQGNDNGEGESGDGDQTAFVGDIEGVSQGGYLALGASSESEAEANGFSLPAAEAGDDPIIVSATVLEDGRWESTEIDFKTIPVEEPIEGEIQVGVPAGLSGELDPEAESMTARGELVATLRTDGETLGEVSFQLDATTGDSGALTGSATFDEQSARATLVDNEFTVSESGNLLVDGAVGLPTAAGENWFELALELTPA